MFKKGSLLGILITLKSKSYFLHINMPLNVNRDANELIFPHEGGECVFLDNPFCGTALECMKQIDRAGLARPSASETVSLIHSCVQNPKGERESVILSRFAAGEKTELFWGDTGCLYLPESSEAYQNGVIFWEGVEFTEEGEVRYDKSKLIEKLGQGDKNVRFAAFGESTGWYYPPEGLEFHSSVKAMLGKEGAKKLVELGKFYDPREFYLGIFENIEHEHAGIFSFYAPGHFIVRAYSPSKYETGYSYGKVNKK